MVTSGLLEIVADDIVCSAISYGITCSHTLPYHNFEKLIADKEQNRVRRGIPLGKVRSSANYISRLQMGFVLNCVFQFTGLISRLAYL